MTAPRAREQRRPPSPPERRPPRRGGGSSPCTYAASAADRPAGLSRLRSTRRVLVRSARALAAAALLALSGALALPAQAQEGTPMACTPSASDLWCGVVTVEEFAFEGTSFAYGFLEASASPNPSDTGALSNKAFTVGTNRYTIDITTVGVGASAQGLNFSLTSALTAADLAKLVLHVDGSSGTFAFSDATRTNAGFTYQWSETGLDWSSETSVTLRLRGPSNNAPEFATDIAILTVPENSAADTVVGTVTATDADDDTLTYSLEGTDAASFDIDSGTGEIKTRSGVTYNYETKFDYEMRAKAEDGNGGSDTIDVRIALLDDQTEKSATPAKPTLVSVPGLFTSLAARWTKPGLNGGPDIVGYEVQYRQGTGGSWTDFMHSGAAPTTTITRLTANTEYQVRVRAWNGEALSDWSDASDPVSTGEAPPPPTVTSVVVASAPQSGSTYHWGETIVFTVTFSEAVRVTGRPELEVGLDNPAGTSGSTVQARFAGLSENGRPGPGARPVPFGRYVLFAYTVQPFDRDADGVRVGADALRLAAGTGSGARRPASTRNSTMPRSAHRAATGSTAGRAWTASRRRRWRGPGSRSSMETAIRWRRGRTGITGCRCRRVARRATGSGSTAGRRRTWCCRSTRNRAMPISTCRRITRATGPSGRTSGAPGRSGCGSRRRRMPMPRTTTGSSRTTRPATTRATTTWIFPTWSRSRPTTRSRPAR